ncbi:MAG: hypothetical protein Q8M56_06465 [Desulfobacterales bacterium]|nr:hypothetical protein [Desulfobacterales bacterium]
MKQIKSLVGRSLYYLMGWRFEPLPPYFSGKHVIIGFPHTSNMDAVRAFTGYWIIGRTGHIMVKKEWFFWPMSFSNPSAAFRSIVVRPKALWNRWWRFSI